MIVLRDAEDRKIVFLFFWTKHWNVMEGRTDGQNHSGYYSGADRCNNVTTYRCVLPYEYS